MANLPLTEIAVPDSDDIFVIGEQERADIVTLQNDLAALEDEVEAIPTKTLPQLTAGSIISDKYSKDEVPYLFRAIKHNAKRLEDCIVGGTVCWNQLVQNGDFSNGTANWVKYSASNPTTSWSANDGVLTHTITGGTTTYAYCYSIYQNEVIRDATHKHLVVIVVEPSVATTFRIEAGGGAKYTTPYTLEANKKTTVSCIVDAFTADKRLLFEPYSAVNQVSAPSMTMKYYSVNVIDLTAMFGSTIADYVYTLEQATAGSGIAWLKSYGFFTKPHYEYDTGTLKSVNPTAHVTRGVNAWDEEWELGQYSPSTGNKTSSNTAIRCKNKIPILPNTQYYFQFSSGAMNCLCFYDANEEFISGSAIGISSPQVRVSPSNAYFLAFQMNDVYGATYNRDICINISNAEVNSKYFPYEEHTYDLGNVELRGIPKLVNNELVYDGDIYTHDGAVTRKYVLVDVSTLTFTTRYTGNTKKLVSANIGSYYNVADPGVMGEKYPYIGSIAGASALSDVDNATYGCYTYNGGTHDYSFYIVLPKDETPSGYVLYKAETPTTETTTPFEQYQICTTGGTEEYTTTNDVPVGHDTKYFTDVIGNIEDIPAPPTADGTYTLKVTVSSGVPTYAWV